MKKWRSGDIAAAASGFVLLAASVLPWVVLEPSGTSRSALELGQGGLLAFGLISGLSLIVLGLLRTSWTALASFTVALVIAFVVLTASLPAHSQSASPGFGLFAMAAGAALAVIAGVLNAIEREGSSV